MFRFWELLLLGVVPVVRTSSLDALYSQFPVAPFTNARANLINLFTQAHVKSGGHSFVRDRQTDPEVPDEMRRGLPFVRRGRPIRAPRLSLNREHSPPRRL